MVTSGMGVWVGIDNELTWAGHADDPLDGFSAAFGQDLGTAFETAFEDRTCTPARHYTPILGRSLVDQP